MKSKKLKGLHAKSRAYVAWRRRKEKRKKNRNVFFSTPLIKFSVFPFLLALLYFSLVLFTFRIQRKLLCAFCVLSFFMCVLWWYFLFVLLYVEWISWNDGLLWDLGIFDGIILVMNNNFQFEIISYKLFSRKVLLRVKKSWLNLRFD